MIIWLRLWSLSFFKGVNLPQVRGRSRNSALKFLAGKLLVEKLGVQHHRLRRGWAGRKDPFLFVVYGFRALGSRVLGLKVVGVDCCLLPGT